MSSTETRSRVERRERTAPHAARRETRAALLSGWGRTAPTRARFVRPADAGEVAASMLSARGGVIPRGAGRSYGDPAQNEGGTVLDLTGLSGVRSVDVPQREVRAGAGTTFAILLEELARHGLTLPVVPGTRHLTVGGAIAADVHGKNHPDQGSLANRLVSFELATPDGTLREVTRESDGELFAATTGGMGLTGAVTAATLAAVPLREPFALADVDRADSIEDAMGLMDGGGHTHEIAWLDLLASGGRFARAVVTRSREGEAPAGAGSLGLAPRPALRVPAHAPGGLLRSAAVRTFNAALWHRSPRRERGRPIGAAEQLFPLDRVADWNRLYGRHGLLQYQFAVPRGQEWVMRCVLELLRARRVPMFLAALKRFGAPSGGLLSFPLEGWTLAIDIPARARGARAVLADADRLVASAGGRVYLAKDARMRPKMLREMYPELGRFRAVRERVDPAGALRSDMARRLELCA
jgi:decaprenylphospho-beta-D-ribofuranose 2-oxidase